jgi:hypothetical protein
MGQAASPSGPLSSTRMATTTARSPFPMDPTERSALRDAQQLFAGDEFGPSVPGEEVGDDR